MPLAAQTAPLTKTSAVMILPSVFSEPAAHDVESITAKISAHSDFVALRLILMGRDTITGAQRQGDFQIFAPLDKLAQLRAIAAAINHEFKDEVGHDPA
jgi:hypothetical protein